MWLTANIKILIMLALWCVFMPALPIESNDLDKTKWSNNLANETHYNVNFFP